MTRLRTKLKDKRGASMYIWALVLFIVILLLLVATMEATRASIVYIGVRDAIESAIITTATSNAYNTYDGIREGNSGAYVPDGKGGWSKTVTTGDVIYKLCSLLRLSSDSGGFVHHNNNPTDIEFRISNLNVKAEIIPLGENKVQSKYYTTCLVSVPFSFGFGYLPDMQIPMKHQSTYMPRF